MAYMSQSAAISCLVAATVKKVCEYLKLVVGEVRWSDRLNHYNHNPHFPQLVTHFIDSMPITFIGGTLLGVLFNPKYAGHIWKLTVAFDHSGNIVWGCLILWGRSMVWKGKNIANCPKIPEFLLVNAHCARAVHEPPILLACKL